MNNVNPNTGIRYGIISAKSLKSWVIDEIQQEGRDVHYEENKDELARHLKALCSEYLDKPSVEEVVDLATSLYTIDYDDEPVHEFDIQGVKGRTTWIGGALMVWVFESPKTGSYSLCSPCVPNCGDLDSEENDEGGYLCYDVPTEWRWVEEVYNDSMDGDFDSAMASAGFGTDEDYGG